MAGMIQCGRRTRKDFGKIQSVVEIPNLIEVQRRSYEGFLQKDVPHDQRENAGLQAVFKSVFPIVDYNENAALEFVGYHFGDPKYTVEECNDRGMTFAIPLKVTLRLVAYEHDKKVKKVFKLRIVYNKKGCAASGHCVLSDPFNFRLDDEFRAILIDGKEQEGPVKGIFIKEIETDEPHLVINAAKTCTPKVIGVIDMDTGKRIAP